MAKVTYASLKLKVDTSVTTFEFNDHTIEVLKYLPIRDKYDLITIARQKATDRKSNLCNPILLDTYIQLGIVYLYTNLTFTDKQREDELKLYDCLKSTGLMDAIINALEETEYDEILEFVQNLEDGDMAYFTSAAAIVNKLVDDLPVNAEAAANIVNNFDPEKLAAVNNFAKAIGYDAAK